MRLFGFARSLRPTRVATFNTAIRSLSSRPPSRPQRTAFPTPAPKPLHPAQVEAAAQQSATAAAAPASGATTAAAASGSTAASAPSAAAGSESTMLKLESEEIQKLLKVVELYLAGGKQQREAVLRALDGEGGGWRETFLELVPRVIANRGFILETLADAADVTHQPIVVARLLATDTKSHTPRQVLDGVLVPPVGRTSPVTAGWLQQLAGLDLNTTHANDAWEFERAFDAVRQSAITAYPKLVAQLHEQLKHSQPTAATATATATAAPSGEDLSLLVECAATFVPFVAEKLHALALFGLKPLIVNTELKSAADDACDSRARAKLADMFRMPTVNDLSEAYAVQPDKARDAMDDRIRRFPTAKVMSKFRALSVADRSAWEPARIGDWLPTWDECSDNARAVMRGPTRSHEFHRYMSSTAQHDLLTVDSLTAIANYVCERLRVYHPPQVAAHKWSGPTARATQPVTILEVGAGSGRFTHFLRKYVDKATRINDFHLPPLKFVASDIAPIKSEIEKVEKLDAAAAVTKYAPSIVVCQWMPPNTDLSAHFRADPSVREYILLGETDSGICGEQWRTWGRAADGILASSAPADRPPFEVDGFKRFDLPEITKHQICKNDNFYAVGWSKAVSFRRFK